MMSSSGTARVDRIEIEYSRFVRPRHAVLSNPKSLFIISSTLNTFFPILLRSNSPFPWITTLLSSPWVSSRSVRPQYPPHRGPPFSPNSASLLFQPSLSPNPQKCIHAGRVVTIPTMPHLPSSPIHLETRQLRPMTSVLFFLSISPRTVVRLHVVQASFCPLSIRVPLQPILQPFLRMYPMQ